MQPASSAADKKKKPLSLSFPNSVSALRQGLQTFRSLQRGVETEAPLQGGTWGENAQPKEEKQIE